MIKEQISNLTAESQELLKKLDLPSNLPEGFGLTKVVETHLSLLLIGKDYVWKLKKPLTLEFVDHSNINQRWTSAHAEIILNRRLAPRIYIGLIPFTVEDFFPLPLVKEPGLSPPDGIGEVAVVMRTISEQSMLSSLIEKGSVDPARDIIPLGRRLANFHQAIPSLDSSEVPGVIENFRKACIANFTTISSLTQIEPEIVAELKKFTQEQWLEVSDTLLKRGERGCFVDGHGDLRCEHIVFDNDEVCAIDCLEFSSSLRVNDRLADIAFLKMDLEFLERTDLWKILYKEYSALMQDTSEELLYYLAIYRAMVRCKVELLSDAQGHKETNHRKRALRYLGLASRFHYKIEGPIIMVTCGLSGTGKSTLAKQLEKLLAAVHIESDCVRKSLFPDPEVNNVKFGQGKYSTAGRQVVYDRLFAEVRTKLRTGEIVIVDGSFAARSNRVALRELAQTSNVPIYWIRCQLNSLELSRRLISRQLDSKSTLSEGRIELLEEQAAAYESFDGSEGGRIIEVDTGIQANILAEQILKTVQLQV